MTEALRTMPDQPRFGETRPMPSAWSAIFGFGVWEQVKSEFNLNPLYEESRVKYIIYIIYTLCRLLSQVLQRLVTGMTSGEMMVSIYSSICFQVFAHPGQSVISSLERKYLLFSQWAATCGVSQSISHVISSGQHRAIARKTKPVNKQNVYEQLRNRIYERLTKTESKFQIQIIENAISANRSFWQIHNLQVTIFLSLPPQ